MIKREGILPYRSLSKKPRVKPGLNSEDPQYSIVLLMSACFILSRKADLGGLLHAVSFISYRG